MELTWRQINTSCPKGTRRRWHNFCSEESFLALLCLLLVAGGDQSGRCNNTEDTEGEASVESGVRLLRCCGSGGLLLGKNLGCDVCVGPGLDVPGINQWLEIILDTFDKVTNHRFKVFLSCLLKLVVEFLVARSKLFVEVVENTLDSLELAFNT